MSRLVAAVCGAALATLASGCCLTGGWHECDSATYVGGCTGQHFSRCTWSSNPWGGVYEELVEGDCAEDEVCIASGPNAAGCVLAPGLPCDPDTHVGRCDGAVPVICAPPGDWTGVSYEGHGSPCLAGYACGLDGRHADCLPVTTTPCPYPPPRPIGCAGSDIVFCSTGASGAHVETMRMPCSTGCVEPSDTFATCR